MNLEIIEAKDLLAMDTKLIGKGASDPYVKVLVGKVASEQFKTKTIKSFVLRIGRLLWLMSG